MYLEQGVFYYNAAPYGAAVYAVSKLTMPPVRAAEFLFLPVFAVFAVAIQPQQGGNIDFGCAKGILRFAQLRSQIEEVAVIVVQNAPVLIQLIDKIEQFFKLSHSILLFGVWKGARFKTPFPRIIADFLMKPSNGKHRGVFRNPKLKLFALAVPNAIFFTRYSSLIYYLSHFVPPYRFPNTSFNNSMSQSTHSAIDVNSSTVGAGSLS
jgi:hypothetical protein